MEQIHPVDLSEIEAIYEDLPELDKAREVYLLATIFREELGLPSAWSPQQDDAQRHYARKVAEEVNTTLSAEVALDHLSPELIEDTIVHHVTAETQHRWWAYTERILGAGKADSFTDKIVSDETVTCSLEEKAQQTRTSWRKYVEDFGQPEAEFNPSVRSEFIRNLTIWDTAKERIFLFAVLASDEEIVAA